MVQEFILHLKGKAYASTMYINVQWTYIMKQGMYTVQ